MPFLLSFNGTLKTQIPCLSLSRYVQNNKNLINFIRELFNILHGVNKTGTDKHNAISSTAFAISFP